MMDRAELVEAALEVYQEGLALVDVEDRVVFWNRAAELLTGHAGAQVVGRALPGALEALVRGRCAGKLEVCDRLDANMGLLVHVQHLRGHDVPAVARRVALRDGLGARIGTAVAFHAAERLEALPHGHTTEGFEVRANQDEMRERLETAHQAFMKDHAPMGVLWIGVDQAREMRRTHGAQAFEAMLESMERALANARRTDEAVGRWGDGEFVMISHERDGAALVNHAQVLAGIARTAEFHWWGDRMTLSVSIGAAQAESGEMISQLLERAQAAMAESMRLGGNRVTATQRRQACLPSLES